MKFIMNNYKLLPALVSILSTKNLTESAKNLNVTQSAMSKTLTQIRQAFDDQILIREGSLFVLTQKGEKLKLQLPALMQQLDDLYLPTSLDLKECQRAFQLSSSDYVAQAVFPEILKQIEALAPKASVEYSLWKKESLLASSCQNIDLVTTIADRVPENLYGQLMAEDQSVVVLSAGQSSDEQVISLEHYLSAKHILITGGGDKDLLIDQALEAKGLQRDILARVPFFQAAIELLLSTNSMLTIPLHIAAEFSKHYDLKIKPLPVVVKPHQYYLLWHAKYQYDSEHQWFRELCLPVLKSHLETRIQQGMKLLHANQ